MAPAKPPAIVAYVPVLHAGYKRLFDKYPNATIYVFGPEIIAEFYQLRKELRALAPEEVVVAVKGWGREARILNSATIKELASSQVELIAPDEDVSRALAERYFSGNQTTFETIFLRWDRRRMEAERDPLNPDRTISEAKFDKEMIGQATKVGRKSSNLWRRMGALIVRDGKTLVSAYNHSHPTPHTSWIDGDPRNNASRGVSIDLTTDIHAEAGAIAEAAKRGIAVSGAAMYVLDFPCPTCAKLIANSGVARLYYGKGYAVLDGEQALQASGVELVHVTGVEAEDPDPDAWMVYPKKPSEPK